ncbi:Copia protein [Vitis vinifera]|uniref:Copia protein n=1 Tax=Vitis vinifera TaxID=29760 RepID=A0A438GTK7_VITVI|nr:Copia protein [Vitis vinifera]
MFNSLCYLHVLSIKSGKLDEKVEKGVFVGYAVEPKVESTSIEDPLDVEATSDTPVLKVRPLFDVYERCNLVHAEPTCYTEAVRFSEWIKAMKAEIDVIERNGTWKLIELLEAKKAIGGFAQVAGVDYGDTFAPVARHDIIRLLFALAGQMGWKMRSENEATLYLKQNEDGLQLVVSLYVDDILVTGSNRKYVVDILKKFKLESCKEVATLLVQNEKISKNDVGLLSRFMSSPSNVHMGVAKRVLKYVRGTKNLGIWYLKTGGVKLDGYADSDWVGSVDDMKSTSSYVFTIGFRPGTKLTTELYYDNKSAIAIAQNFIQHGMTKHINVKFHSIREAENNSLIKLHYCSTDVQLADIMTKAFPKSRLEFLRLKLGMSKANLKEKC